MKYRIFLKPKAQKFIEGLRDKSLQKRLTSGMESLVENPFSVQSKKLSGYDTRYRLRVGDYRIIYQIDLLSLEFSELRSEALAGYGKRLNAVWFGFYPPPY